MKRARTALLALVLMAVLATPIAAAADRNSAINWDSNAADNPYIYEDTLTVAQHNMSAMSSPLQYYDDNGDVASLDATLNSSIDNPLAYRADKVSADVLTKFPRNGESDNSASAIDASEWTKDASGSAGTGTISSATVAGGVDAVQLSTSSQTSGDSMQFTYSNFTVDSDAAKRVALLVGSVDTLESGATVHINFTESDGDRKSATISPGADASAADVAANSTAQGLVYQVKLNDLATRGSGDGSFNAIDSVTVTVDDANAQLTLTGFDVERKSKMAFGSHTDDDGDSVTTYHNPDGGVISLSSLDTLPSAFSSAQIYDFEVQGVEYRASYAANDDVFTNFTEAANYPNFAKKLRWSTRLTVPAAIDLSHSGLELRDEQGLVSSRYIDFRYAEGTGDKDPSDVSSWTDASGKLGDKGATLTLDSTIQPGQAIMVQGFEKLTSSEANELQQAPAGAGGGPVGGSGGFWSMLISLPGLIATGIVAALGFKLKGS